MPAGVIKTIIPRLPSRNLENTLDFYFRLGFIQYGNKYPEYVMISRNECELHFFLFKELNPLKNYGMCYVRVNDVDDLYRQWNAALPSLKPPELKPWRQKEFTVLDPDHNAVTFGEAL